MFKKRRAGKLLPLLLAVGLCLGGLSLRGRAVLLPAIRSESYIVVEASSGQILLEKNAREHLFPASITKILTTALALEHQQESGETPDTPHTMTYEAAHSIEPGSTHIALTEEEVVTVRDLLYATMVQSANDAANGLAEYAAGNLGAFPALMNAKAVSLGAADSHFVNANGLHDPEHYTCAYDMALITRWALGVPGFREVFGATEYTVPPTNKQPYERKIGTHDHMLVESAYYYEGTLGGKLGWTPEAQHTLVTLAQRDGLELICVVMKTASPYEKYQDTIALLDASFAAYAGSDVIPQRFRPDPIPVFEGEKQVGEIVLSDRPLTFAKPVSLARADLAGEVVAPERYEKGEEIAPRLILRDNRGAVLATLSVPWEYRDLALAAEAAVPDQKEPMPGWQIALLVCGGLFLLLYLIRLRNLRLARIRREKRLARSRPEELDAFWGRDFSPYVSDVRPPATIPPPRRNLPPRGSLESCQAAGRSRRIRRPSRRYPRDRH